MNYDQSNDLINLVEKINERSAQMADDLNFIRYHLGNVDEETEVPKAVEVPARKIKEDRQENIFNDEDDVLVSQYDTASNFAKNNEERTVKEPIQIEKPAYTAADAWRIFNVLLFIANERPNTFAQLLENHFNVTVEKSTSRLQYVYNIIHENKIMDVDKALKAQKLNNDDLYTVYDKFK